MHTQDDHSRIDMAPQPVEILSLVNLDIDKIRLNPYQPRKSMDSEHLAELAESIREKGILEPLIVRRVDGEAYELVAGERRFRAAVSAGLRTVPAIARVLDDRQSLEIALIENIQREDIAPIECAEAYRRLMDEFDLTQEEVAGRVGKKRSTVANTLRLLNLPACILESLRDEEITEGHARALLSIQDPDEQVRVWQKVVKDGLSVRQAEQVSRHPGMSRTRNVARATGRHGQPDPNLDDIEDKLRRYLGTKVSITRGRDAGKIEIAFYDQEDLIRILELISDAG